MYEYFLLFILIFSANVNATIDYYQIQTNVDCINSTVGKQFTVNQANSSTSTATVVYNYDTAALTCIEACYTDSDSLTTNIRYDQIFYNDINKECQCYASPACTHTALGNFTRYTVKHSSSDYWITTPSTSCGNLAHNSITSYRYEESTLAECAHTCRTLQPKNNDNAIVEFFYSSDPSNKICTCVSAGCTYSTGNPASSYDRYSLKLSCSDYQCQNDFENNNPSGSCYYGTCKQECCSAKDKSIISTGMMLRHPEELISPSSYCRLTLADQIDNDKQYLVVNKLFGSEPLYLIEQFSDINTDDELSALFLYLSPISKQLSLVQSTDIYQSLLAEYHGPHVLSVLETAFTIDYNKLQIPDDVILWSTENSITQNSEDCSFVQMDENCIVSLYTYPNKHVCWTSDATTYDFWNCTDKAQCHNTTDSVTNITTPTDYDVDYCTVNSPGRNTTSFLQTMVTQLNCYQSCDFCIINSFNDYIIYGSQNIVLIVFFIVNSFAILLMIGWQLLDLFDPYKSYAIGFGCGSCPCCRVQKALQNQKEEQHKNNSKKASDYYYDDYY